jgi:hypothetical protein
MYTLNKETLWKRDIYSCILQVSTYLHSQPLPCPSPAFQGRLSYAASMTLYRMRLSTEVTCPLSQVDRFTQVWMKQVSLYLHTINRSCTNQHTINRLYTSSPTEHALFTSDARPKLHWRFNMQHTLDRTHPQTQVLTQVQESSPLFLITQSHRDDPVAA